MIYYELLEGLAYQALQSRSNISFSTPDFGVTAITDDPTEFHWTVRYKGSIHRFTSQLADDEFEYVVDKLCSILH